MATIRKIKVRGNTYLQVVMYEYDQSGKRHIKVLKSFGQDTPINYLKAKQFEANYNALDSVLSQPSVDSTEKVIKLENLALATFGAILGYKVIKKLFGKHTDVDKRNLDWENS